MSQIRRFVETHPAVPVFLVDVIAERDLSRRLAQELGVGHESPQVILLREGQPCWNGSHFEVTAERTRGWQRDFALFRRLFVGESDNARDVVLTIHWRGGQHSELRVRKPSVGA